MNSFFTEENKGNKVFQNSLSFVYFVAFRKINSVKFLCPPR